MKRTSSSSAKVSSVNFNICTSMLSSLVWKSLFDGVWKIHRTRFQSIISDIRRRKELVESGASAIQFEMLEQSLAITEAESQQQREFRGREEMKFVRDWLAAAPVQEDHEEKQNVRSVDTGSCEWVLDNSRYQTWEDVSSSSPLLWIHGIPGAGKVVVSVFSNHSPLMNSRKVYPNFLYHRPLDANIDTGIILLLQRS